MKKRTVVIIIAVIAVVIFILMGYIIVTRAIPAIAEAIKNIIQNFVNDLFKAMFSRKDKTEAIIESGRRLLQCLSLI